MLTKEQKSEVAAWIKEQPEAIKLGQVYEDLAAKLQEKFSFLQQETEDWTLSEADTVIRAFLFWWTWGN